MKEETPRSDEFWDDLERTVAQKVEAVLHDRQSRRKPVMEYLRQVEEMARTECSRRQTVQIIASGRSLLGDRRVVGPKDGPFAHA